MGKTKGSCTTRSVTALWFATLWFFFIKLFLSLHLLTLFQICSFSWSFWYLFSYAWSTNLVTETGMSSKQLFGPHLYSALTGLWSLVLLRSLLDVVTHLFASWRKKIKNMMSGKNMRGKRWSSMSFCWFPVVVKYWVKNFRSC